MLVLLVAWLLPGWGIVHGAAAVGEPGRPNIVLILADDLGYGDIGCYGHPDTKTPAIDRLAAQGVRFTSFYANGPECTPTRTALMTGQYQQRSAGMECAIGLGNVGRYDDAIRLAGAGDLGLPAGRNALVGGMKKAGYTVVGLGKWHLGYDRKFWPLAHGFDRFFGPLGGAVDYYHHCEPDGPPMLIEGDQFVKREGYLTDLITDEAVRFIGGHDPARPFFLYLPYTAPHTPIQPPDAKPAQPCTLADFNKGTREDYQAMVERLDQGVGRILAELDRRGLAGNTLVIFTSDNGATRTGRNDPFSGYKGGTYEGGIRVPCIMRWPGVLPAGRASNRVGMTMDLTASFLRLAGADARNLDGIDLIDAERRNAPQAQRPLFWRQRRGETTWRGVRDGGLKYISRAQGPKLEEHLFDLLRDPAEKEDLRDARPDDVARLKRLLTAWERDVRADR